MDEDEKDIDTYVTETKFNRKTGLPVFQRTLLNGLRQTPPDDTPSQVKFDEKGRPTYMVWHDKNRPHREDSGAVLHINPDTGVIVSEAFFIHGKPMPQHLGPRQILRDDDTGQIIEEIYNDGSLSSSLDDSEMHENQSRTPSIEP